MCVCVVCIVVVVVAASAAAVVALLSFGVVWLFFSRTVDKIHNTTDSDQLKNAKVAGPDLYHSLKHRHGAGFLKRRHGAGFLKRCHGADFLSCEVLEM